MKDIISRINKLLGYNLPIENDEDIFAVLEKSNIKNFDKIKFEKDFYLTVLLHRITREIPQIKFKGGTCLNRVYFPYFRLSEDLDFALSIEEDFVNSASKRQKFAEFMRSKMKDICSLMHRKLNKDEEQHGKAWGHKDLKKLKHTYLKYVLTYPSIFDQKEQTIKIEITYTDKHYLPFHQGDIKSIFIDPLLEEDIFPKRKINCLSLEEMIAEKMRAALTRKEPAIRDFFDLGYVKDFGFNFDSIHQVIDYKVAETEHGYTVQDQYSALQEQIKSDLEPVLENKYSDFDFDNIYNFVLSFKQ